MKTLMTNYSIPLKEKTTPKEPEISCKVKFVIYRDRESRKFDIISGRSRE
jgi:hypothetical protein